MPARLHCQSDGGSLGVKCGDQESELVRKAKKPIRYEAVIDNWKRYQSAKNSAVVALKER